MHHLFFILILAAFGDFFSFFAQTFCDLARVILSVWERAGLLQGLFLSGEGKGWNVFVFLCVCCGNA